jgi:hypothetical protein
VTSPSNNPSDIPSTTPEAGGTQLGLLLDAAKDMLAEEIRRTDRLETRSRHLITACGALFAVVIAATVGLLSALLDAKNGEIDGWVIPTLGGFTIASVVSLGAAFAWTQTVQKLRETNALDPKTIDDYIVWAEKGHVAVAKNLITTYASLLRSRRGENDERAQDLKRAADACRVAAAASVCLLAAVIVAVFTQ